MNIIAWNVRGLTDESKRLLKEHCSSFSPIILGLIEPKKAFRKVRQSYWNSLNMVPIHQNCRASKSSNIWVLAHPDVIATMLLYTEPITRSSAVNFGMIFSISRRVILSLLVILTQSKALMRGSVLGPLQEAHAWTSALSMMILNSLNLRLKGFALPGLDVGFFPIMLNLSLIEHFFSKGFADLCDSIVTTALPRLTSDHSPLVLQCRQVTPSGIRHFRFLNMWTLHPSFLDMVKNSWTVAVNTSCPILCVMLKLKRLRYDIKVWNKDVFGNVDNSIGLFQNHLAVTQNQISETGYTDELFDEEIRLQAELNVALSRKNNLLQQKSRASWLQDGDRNTTFFHRMIKFKRRNTLITRLNIDGVDVYDPSIIEQHIIGHFSALFMDDGSPSADPLEIEALFDLAVSDAQNNFLVSIPAESEIAAEVFGMDANSAPGPDGFSGSFFQTCWEIIKTDVVSAVQTFFRSSYLPTCCNSSTMILIPKKKDVSTVADLRPIVLSNFFFKIISKILASRLSRIASTHISNNQFGFISGRNIHDCIMLSSEGFNSMQRTNRGSNMACKIDIRKAFDTIRWEFIMQVLRANGYHEKFVNWIWIIFSSARLSILYNGQLSGYFSCSRGVRQGDPLSPILFGIAEDVLSHLISSCVESRHLSPMGFSRATNFPTHLFYADDIILFSTATVRNARKIKEILNYYGSISGQVCSQEKSNLYFARGVTTDRRRARVMGFSVGNLPMTYLGVPIFVGRPRASFLMPIFDKIVQKFARWKGLQLSIAGRLCLVRSVIQSSIVHSMMVYKWPKSLLHSLDRKCRNFIWTGSIDQQPRCSVSWRRVCAPKEEGGLGIRSFTLMNKSFLMKLAWKMIKGDDWAHRIMRSRYLTTFSYAKQNIANSTIWLGVKQEIDSLVVDSYSCINNDANTYFWKDDWLGYILVDKLKIPHHMHDYLHFSVKDYYYDGLWHFPPSFVNYFPEVVADILLIPMSEEKDSRYWKHSLKGDVSAALAFSKNCQRYTMVKWGTWIWEPYIPIRRSILCWRILHGRLPTLDTLVRQGMVTPNGCPFCYMDAETIEHIMWSCPRISYIWETFLVWFHKTDLLSCLDIHTFLVLGWNACFSPQILAFWKGGIISILWKIWDCRNALVFDDLRFEPRSILTFVKAYFKEMDSNFSRLGTIKNNWTDYVIVRSLGIGSRAAPPPRMVEVYWWPPVTHWIKVNTDGSAKGAPGRIAAGGVFRDNFAYVRGCFHIKGGSGFAFEAELLAVITAINIAHDRGWLHLWVESDSMYVVRLLENRSTNVPWRFLASWKQVLRRLHGFSLIVTHIFREENHPADIMANDDRQEGWWPYAIDDIKHAVARWMLLATGAVASLGFRLSVGVGMVPTSSVYMVFLGLLIFLLASLVVAGVVLFLVFILVPFWLVVFLLVLCLFSFVGLLCFDVFGNRAA
ncbi:uncharacterized protein LOC131007877 [Salvia miltiorrhiza]|uniref:uncharacterized protein LOC131007877 n=1 Tax=Salvia miltiorrhiza TaxID=226208 RepID=UPI0025AD2FC3|nr:uncharacterized protein LOC131007877 [Salvia miltiorrhiza]